MKSFRSFTDSLYLVMSAAALATIFYIVFNHDEIKKSLKPTFRIDSPWGIVNIYTPWAGKIESVQSLIKVNTIPQARLPQNKIYLPEETARYREMLRNQENSEAVSKVPQEKVDFLHKCKMHDGEIVYQDFDCPIGTESQTQISSTRPSLNSLTLIGNSSHQYQTSLTINGVSTLGQIDTGASFVTISESTARLLKITHEGSVQRYSVTANGTIPTLNKVIPLMKIGNFELSNVEIAITSNSPTLIGMSALGRIQLKMENGKLMLSKR